MLQLRSRISGKLPLTILSVSLAIASCGWVTPNKSTKDAPADMQTPAPKQSKDETQSHKPTPEESHTEESPTPINEQSDSQPPITSTPSPAPSSPTTSPAPPVQTAETTQFDGSAVKWFRNTEYPQLGEAWRAPDGGIWGDIAKDSSGRPLNLTYSEARDYCYGLTGLAARLPYLKEFQRLVKYMGAKGDLATNWREKIVGYKPQVLPNLTYLTGDGKVHSYTFWGQRIDDSDPVEFAYFVGSIGIVSSASLTAVERRNVRCVPD